MKKIENKKVNKFGLEWWIPHASWDCWNILKPKLQPLLKIEWARWLTSQCRKNGAVLDGMLMLMLCLR